MIEGEVITKAEFDARCEAMRELGCVCCLANLRGFTFRATGFGVPEVHHLNEDGKAGNARRGDRFTIPLCAYHHRGEIPADARRIAPSLTPVGLALVYGPALTMGGPIFRATYGCDDTLLAWVDEKLGLTD